MKKPVAILASLALALVLTSCGESVAPAPTAASKPEPVSINEEPVVVSVSEVKEPETREPETREGMVRSDLTNEWIPEEIENQRPVAIMVDNDRVAQPHYGTSKADIVYELINSTANNRVTRLMCLVKDWKNIECFGNVRSTRPTNVILFPEYNAILVHDGGPFYIDEWFQYENATNHLSGGFARIDRKYSSGKDKDSTYEEYVTAEDYKGTGNYSGRSYPGLMSRIAEAGYSEQYNRHYMGRHFSFSDETLSLEGETGVREATHIAMPYGHNQSELKYNKETGLYDFYEFGELYKDALYDTTLSFANVIVYECKLFQYDANGYMLFNCITGADGLDAGYYLTGGKAIPIKWKKPAQQAMTSFTNASTGEEIVLNTGKTYITIVPSDSWSDLIIE
ncbi:MAG: DUF3048 domain-containing protein [Lachnospiraceae bacterium]|nr:DUF3048 domain-containing protein [Lachnospiraceae bacterium]